MLGKPGDGLIREALGCVPSFILRFECYTRQAFHGFRARVYLPAKFSLPVMPFWHFLFLAKTYSFFKAQILCHLSHVFSLAPVMSPLGSDVIFIPVLKVSFSPVRLKTEFWLSLTSFHLALFSIVSC